MKKRVFIQIIALFLLSSPGWAQKHSGRKNLDSMLMEQKIHQLGLESLEKGYDSLQIRVWFDYSMAKTKHLVVLKRNHGQWDGRLYTMQTAWYGDTDSMTIVRHTVRKVVPEMGWNNFTSKLFDQNITTLPEGEDGGMDGVTYNIEIATKKSYRHYKYWSPETTEKKYRESRNMVKIIELLTEVCHFSRSQE